MFIIAQGGRKGGTERERERERERESARERERERGRRRGIAACTHRKADGKLSALRRARYIVFEVLH